MPTKRSQHLLKGEGSCRLCDSLDMTSFVSDHRRFVPKIRGDGTKYYSY